MPVKTIRLNAQGHGVLVCDQCGKTKVAQLAEVAHRGKLLHIKCSCGHRFMVSIEARRFYRKQTHLPGAYAKTNRDRGTILEQGSMTVEDMSRTGLRLRLTRSHTLRVHDVIEVRFTLDNAQHSAVRKQARVMWVDGSCVGAAWLDSDVFNDTNRFISTYLMAD
jgi:Arc/MetJ family transcription regulator